jgi:hypothetical protein
MKFNTTPLETVNVRVFQEPLDGLIRNCDSDLGQYLDQVSLTNDRDEVVRITLLLLALRFAVNSYRAVCFLLADTDDHPKRLTEFVIVVPPVVRQLIDLWCSLIYILDDFAVRTCEFESCAWLEVTEHIGKMRKRYGSDPEWQVWFDNTEELKKMLEERVPDHLKADPSKIAYWPTPSKLLKRTTKSHAFLEFIHSWLYDETSAEAHLKPGGLLAAGSFLLKDRSSEEIRRQIESRTFHEYKARRFYRTMVLILGIVSEIEMFSSKNKEQATKVWTLLAAYSPDAKSVFDMRYRKALA